MMVYEETLPDERRRRMCFGKRMMNKQQALQTAVRMRKELGATSSLQPYKCAFCGRYHVGNNRKLEAA